MTSAESGRAKGGGGAEQAENLVQRILRLGLPGSVDETLPSVSPGAEPTAAGPVLEPGRAIGEFRLVALLGQGGMAQVWEAEQLTLGGRRVALKFIRPECVSGRTLELFAREARAGGRLSHPGIVMVYGHGTADGLAWLALELVEGGRTLKHVLQEARQATELPAGHDRHVARLVADVAEAMHVAHAAGVIHRDLKPHNVLLAPGERPKVTDFGLARITDETQLSVSGDLAGTFAYMSPEQLTARRMRIDHRTDVFSLGVVLYELIVLRRPFEGDTLHQIAAQILEKDPPDPRTIRSRVPRDLAVIAAKALEKQPEKRYPSCAELAADLRRFLADEPIRAQPPTRSDRLVKWARRNPAKAVAGATAGAAFVVISALLVANVRANRALAAKTTESEGLRKQAEAQRTAALAASVAERERADEVLRLSALQRLEDLEAEADALWPPHPQNLDRYAEWLGRAGELIAELSDHERKLAELDAVAPERTDDRTRWWRDQLRELVAGIQAFGDKDTGLAFGPFAGARGWGVARRAEFARTIAARSVSGADAAARWSEAVASIADSGECPPYRGLRIRPQIGLYPLGRDATSGLWEFAHLMSGEPPERDAAGALVRTESSALVLVLLPAGTFWMGSQGTDANGRNYDPEAGDDEGPLREVSLAPYFLSKYEMTQGQWQALVGTNPSFYAPERGSKWTRVSLLHPVEQVSWLACVRELGRLGLTLPSEAQWEYACRAGMATPWSTGSSLASLRGYANIADEGSAGSYQAGWGFEPGFADGWDVHGPTGSHLPNRFGLVEMHGNVWEWCLDGYGVYDAAQLVEPLSPPAGAGFRVFRGGSWNDRATLARSANRLKVTPEVADRTLGLRPARALDE